MKIEWITTCQKSPKSDIFFDNFVRYNNNTDMSELFSDAILEFHHESAANCRSKPNSKQVFFKAILNKTQHTVCI